MNVLILYCSTGGGHISAGKALQEELELRGHHADIVDTYTIVSDRLAEWLGHSYDHMVQRTPILWGMFYQIGRFRSSLPFHTLVYKLNRYMGEPMRKFFNQHPYDVVLSLHVFPAEMLGGMKEQGIPVPKTVMVTTDYTCPPLTAEADNDFYIVPAEQMEKEFISEGIPRVRLRALGIPVRREFSVYAEANRSQDIRSEDLPLNKLSSPCTIPDSLQTAQSDSHTDLNQFSKREPVRQLAARQLGLDPGRHYLLLSGGSIGAGQIWTAAKTIAKYLKSHPAYDLIIICGNNDRLYEKLKKHYQNNAQIRLLRHTDRMAAYMRASDVLISKPGGLTSTEAAVCGVPLIHISPIPGCERENAKFFAKMGMSLYPKNCRRKLSAALKQLENPTAVEQMIRRQQQRINPRAAADICDFAEQIAQTEGRTANCSGEAGIPAADDRELSKISHSLC
ncbi:MAG: hypothetical protein LUG54_07140 [Clostridiales bacterium]|nr:hypothetical protein [Clostridiales bacterium]